MKTRDEFIKAVFEKSERLPGYGGGCARQEKTAAAGRDGDGFGSGVSDLGCWAFGDAWTTRFGRAETMRRQGTLRGNR